jgi:hypothetical protein
MTLEGLSLRDFDESKIKANPKVIEKYKKIDEKQNSYGERDIFDNFKKLNF